MTEPAGPLRIAIVAGEESGDLLGADLVRSLASLSGRPVELVGVGGRHLEALGLDSLFPSHEIALMGLTAVIRDLPRLVRRIGRTADHIVRQGPDCLVTIDSPAFTMRVAKKVRAADPTIPILKYVCPSVWAWGPWRARGMKPHVDHVLCLLPFEPAELERLDGPPGTFVGHRLAREPGLLAARAANTARRRGEGEPTLLLLPGSRKAEVSGLLDLFRDTVAGLDERGVRPRLILPTMPRLEELVKAKVADWPRRPDISTDVAAKHDAFAKAEAALAASGTVTLELALAGVPLVSVYRSDPLVAWIGPKLITTWTASLPNLVADRVVVPEYFNDQLRPQRLARHLEQLLAETPERAAQLSGFELVADRLTTDRPSGEIAAETILRVIGERGGQR
ncbi:MAG: lipid-A-disaccharide synthase [Rhizobiaceae bacterium]|nr:lipid-A-disaccharide synthase [Rhizobiaceae bacterium]MCV0407193.1 lipid-A-disaccharide synthase [Rhizobiaceae bacterium]